MPLNFRLAQPELEYIINDSKPALLICSEAFSDIAGNLKVSRKLTLGSNYESLLATAEPADDKHWRISADAPFVILYTSGTTGRPKGTIISNHALLARISCNVFEYRLTTEDRFLMSEILTLRMFLSCCPATG